MSKLKIYTDGSHFKNGGSGRLGIGGIIVKDGRIINKLSMEIDPSFLRVHYGTSDVSNPTCEMLGVLMALSEFKHDIGPNDTVEVLSDYTGVTFWMTNKWKINKPYIAKIKSDIMDEINNQNLKGRISFNWVKGHSTKHDDDANYNDIVDKLAKGEEIL